jgi:hypothetical protein
MVGWVKKKARHEKWRAFYLPSNRPSGQLDSLLLCFPVPPRLFQQKRSFCEGHVI